MLLPCCNLTGDIIEIILLKLPTKSLLRFKAVCKPWCAFISSPYFFQRYLLQPLTTHKLLVLSDHYDDDDDGSDFSLLAQDSSVSGNSSHHISRSPIPPPFPYLPQDDMQILDSRNGLVCLSTRHNSNIVLWNPATRKFRVLEEPDPSSSVKAFTFAGLGYVEATNDYKIVRITCDITPGGIGLFWIYTLSSGSWRKLDIDMNRFVFQPRPPVFVNGCLNWLTNRDVSGNLVASFDVANEVACFMPVPDKYGSQNEISRQLVVIRGSVSIVVFSTSPLELPVLEVWVMAEYGVQGSWSMQFKLEPLPVVSRPLTSWKDGELIFRYDKGSSKKLMFYNPFSKRRIYFTEFEAFSFQCFNYIETLESVEAGRTLLNSD